MGMKIIKILKHTTINIFNFHDFHYLVINHNGNNKQASKIIPCCNYNRAD